MYYESKVNNGIIMTNDYDLVMYGPGKVLLVVFGTGSKKKVNNRWSCKLFNEHHREEFFAKKKFDEDSFMLYCLLRGQDYTKHLQVTLPVKSKNATSYPTYASYPGKMELLLEVIKRFYNDDLILKEVEFQQKLDNSVMNSILETFKIAILAVRNGLIFTDTYPRMCKSMNGITLSQIDVDFMHEKSIGSLIPEDKLVAFLEGQINPKTMESYSLIITETLLLRRWLPHVPLTKKGIKTFLTRKHNNQYCKGKQRIIYKLQHFFPSCCHTINILQSERDHRREKHTLKFYSWIPRSYGKGFATVYVLIEYIIDVERVKKLNIKIDEHWK
eukprot:Pgem_evm2s18885